MVSKSMLLKDFTYLLNQTTKFLPTPYEKRKLTPIYQLVWDINSHGQWVLGYDNDLWKIGKADKLEKQGYQVNFTDDDLKAIAGDNKQLLAKLNAMITYHNKPSEQINLLEYNTNNLGMLNEYTLDK